MKIKIKDTTEREIEIAFPSYYKSVKEHSIFTNGYTYTINVEYLNFQNLVLCDKSEVDKIFIYNQKLFSSIMNPVTLDDNLPTEQLEKL